MLALALAACVSPSPGPAADRRIDPPPLAAPPPPIVLVPGPYVPASTVTWTVRNLEPGETAWLLWSKRGPGAGRCPPELLGDCFDVLGGHFYGPEVADGSGSAVITHTFTNPTPPLTDVWAQAAVLRADGTVAKSEVVHRTLLDGASSLVGDAIVDDAADLLALAGVVAITGDLVVEGTALAAIDLPALQQVGGDVRIWENDALVTLNLPALTHVGGDLSLYDDPLLASLGGLSALRTVGGTLSLNRLPALVDLRGLEALETIGQDLYLFHDTALGSVEGLSSLRTVGRELDLWELYALSDARFPALETVGTKIDLFDADQLVTLSFPALTALRAYELHECDAIGGVGDFPLLAAVDGSVIAKWSDAVTTLAGFAALGSAASVELEQLPALAAIDLPALASVGTLRAVSNDALADPGLPALKAVTTEAIVVNNPSLSQCALDALFDRVQPPQVACGGNLDDGCSGWCLVDTGP